MEITNKLQALETIKSLDLYFNRLLYNQTVSELQIYNIKRKLEGLYIEVKRMCI